MGGEDFLGDNVVDSETENVSKVNPKVTYTTKKEDKSKMIETDVLILRMLVDYMADGLIGPFQVVINEPSFYQNITGSKGTTYSVTGPDYTNRLKIEFNEPNIAKDIAFALNRAYGFEDLSTWSATAEEQKEG